MLLCVTIHIIRYFCGSYRLRRSIEKIHAHRNPSDTNIGPNNLSAFVSQPKITGQRHKHVQFSSSGGLPNDNHKLKAMTTCRGQQHTNFATDVFDKKHKMYLFSRRGYYYFFVDFIFHPHPPATAPSAGRICYETSNHLPTSSTPSPIIIARPLTKYLLLFIRTKVGVACKLDLFERRGRGGGGYTKH